MEAVSQELGFSRPWLRKFCIRHQIPHPARGYWRQCETGHGRIIPSLDDPQRNPTFDLEISQARAEQLDRLWGELQVGRGPPALEFAHGRLVPPATGAGACAFPPDPATRAPPHAAPAPTAPPAPSAPTSPLLSVTLPAAPVSERDPCVPQPPQPDLAWLDLAADRYEHFLCAQRALDALQRCVCDCPPLTAAVMTTLVEAARAAVTALDPTRDVIATVRDWLRTR